MCKKLTTEEFIEKAKKIHGNKYDYSKVLYKDAKTKVCIICKEHGEFSISPNKHLSGQRCKFCGLKEFAKSQTFTQEEFIKIAREVH